MSVERRARAGIERRRARESPAPFSRRVVALCVTILALCARARAATPTVPATPTVVNATECSRTTLVFPGADADGHAMEVLIVATAAIGRTYVDAKDTELPAMSATGCNPEVESGGAKILAGRLNASYVADRLPTTETAYTTVRYILRDSRGLCSVQSTLTIAIVAYDKRMSRYVRACDAKWTKRNKDVSAVDAVDWWSNPSLPLSDAEAAGNGQFPKVIDSSMTVYGWGDNSLAQLSLGHTHATFAPETNLRFEQVKQFAYIAAAEQVVFGVEHGTGLVWGWGYDVSGVLNLRTTGSGTVTVAKTPVRIGNLTDITKVSVGSHHAAAINGKGFVFTWGGDSEGQLGRGWTPGALHYVKSDEFIKNKSLPARVVNNGFGGLVAVDVATGSSHTLALDSGGEIWVWGSNLDGQLGLKPCEISKYGDGMGACSSDPAPEMAYTDSPMKIRVVYDVHGIDLIGGVKFESISASARYSMAITADQTSVAGGQLYTWGYGDTGQLGHGLHGTFAHVDPRRSTIPRAVSALSGSRIIFAAAGEFHAAALSSNGQLYTWGLNTYGQLGHSDRVNRHAPELVAVFANANVNISWVSCGRSHTIAVSDFGEVYAWGSNEYGQLGLAPRPVQDVASNWMLTLRGWMKPTVSSRRRLLVDSTTSAYTALFRDFPNPDLSGRAGAANAEFQAVIMNTARAYSGGYVESADIGMYGDVEYVASPVIVEGIQQVGMAVAIGGSSLALRISCSVGLKRDPFSGVCAKCPVGYYTDDVSSFDCLACAPGAYQNVPGSSSCILCAPGTYTDVAARDACTPCANGTFLPFSGATASDQCESCPMGTYSGSTGSSTCTPCAAGTYQNGARQPSCIECGPGTFNSMTGAKNSTACLKCPAGTFTAGTGESKCSPCDAGFYTEEPGASACKECPIGSYSPGGLSKCIDCPRGTARNATSGRSVDDCAPCAPGEHMPFSGQGICTVCPDGTYSDASGASSCTPCPAGYVGRGDVDLSRLSLDAACKQCGAGTYSATRGTVGSGAAGSEQFCTLCALGTYQDEAGQTSCKPCPIGTFNNEAGSAVETRCKPCAEGTYAPFTGMQECIKCPPGTFSNYTGTSQCSPCGAGTFSKDFGSSEESQCNECEAGQYSSAGQQCQFCEPGTYQDENKQDACKLCPAGTFRADSGATTELQCEACPVGTFASSTGSTECTPCAAGSYSDATKAVECTSCPEGTFLPFTRSSNSADCLECPTGSVAAVVGTANCALCAVGTYNDVTKAKTCKPCPAGSYNPNEGSVLSDECLLCGLGSYSAVEGSFECSDCPEGTYGDELGMSACKRAPAGSYLPAIGSTSAASILPCATGTYSDVDGSAACKSCPAGTFGNSTGLTVCVSCAEGTYSTFDGSDSSENCLECEVGKYSALGSIACTQCSAGTYGDVQGLAQCKTCPAGKYGTAVGSTSSASCLDCALGTFSKSAGSQTCTPCAAGKYADETGLVICKDCAPGTYGTATGAKVGDNSTCLKCPLGAASQGGGSSCPQCLPGTYTDVEGSSTCKLCPAGTYGVDSGAKTVSQCDKCPLFHFNSTPGSNSIEACSYYHSAASHAGAIALIIFVLALIVAID